jgi:protein-tyrosine-phosphatase
MAKALFRMRLQGRGCDAEVASAGSLTPGVEPPAEVVEVMAGYGIDISGHRSRILSPELVAQADLVATMTRQQLIELVAQAGSAWTRCFTLTDLVRRAEAVGPPGPDEPIEGWVRRLHSARSRTSLLSLDLSDDINDPMNGRRSAFARVADEIDDLVGRLAKVVCPVGADISA